MVTFQAERRRRTSQSIARYFERCGERDDLMQQVHTSMAATTTDAEPTSVVKPTQKSSLLSVGSKMISPDLLDDSKTDDIGIRIHTIRDLMEKLKDIADSLGIGKTDEEEEEEEEIPKKKKLSIVQQKPKMDVKIFNGKI